MFRRHTIAAAAAVLFTAGAAQAACPAPFGQDRTFFMDISPSDGPLEVFCRIQKYPGPHQVNIKFLITNVNKTFDLNFPGQGAELQGEVLRDLLQSILPAERGLAVDPVTGQAFSRVWSHVVQGSASTTPSEHPISLAMPPETAVGQAAMLWEPMLIQVFPVQLAGINFTLKVELKPSPGRLLYEVGGMQALVVGAWKERLQLGSFYAPECSATIPVCEHLQETVPVHFAMSVGKTVLEATGDNISLAADQVLKSMARTPGTRTGNDPNAFDLVRGDARMDIEDLPFTVTVEATPGKVGTGKIRIVWDQREGQGLSWTERIWKLFETQRETLTRSQSVQRRS